MPSIRATPGGKSGAGEVVSGGEWGRGERGKIGTHLVLFDTLRGAPAFEGALSGAFPDWRLFGVIADLSM